MTTLLQLYGLPIIASGTLSACLAVIGAHIAARDRAMQTLCLTQGALFGVLLGLGIASVFEWALRWGEALPFVGAFWGSLGTLIVSEKFVKSVEASRNTFFSALFALLMSTGYLVSAFFPGLENHMTQRYFGDLAVMTDTLAWVAMAVSLMSGVALIVFSRKLTQAAFFENLLGLQSVGEKFSSSYVATFLMLAVISFSTQVVGMLFTVTVLFVPTTILCQMRGGYRTHLLACALVACSASVVGFVASLSGPHLPTVPCIGLCMVLFAGAAAAFSRLRSRIRARVGSLF